MFAVKQAFRFCLAVAWYLIGLSDCVYLLFKVAFNNACHVWHATVAELEVKFVENFMEPVVQTLLIKKIDDFFADICFDFHVVPELNSVRFFSLVSCGLEKSLNAWGVICMINGRLFLKPRRKKG